MKNRLATLAVSTALVLIAGAGSAPAATRSVRPTSTPADFAAVRTAMHELAAGDTLVLESGIFDWSANVSDTSEAVGLPGGLKISVPGLTIAGRKGTILRGARDATGSPVQMKFGTNAAFRNAPGVHNVTIRSISFEGFENAVVLLQSDSLATVRPLNAYRAGTRGWTLEDLSVRSGPYGIVANGKHTDLVIRRCRFQLAVPATSSGRSGAFGIGIRPYPPLYRGLPERLTVEDNVIEGPSRGTGQILSGIIVTADSSIVRRNQVRSFDVAFVLEGKRLTAADNHATRCGIGIVAWTTNRLGTETLGARIRGNEIRSMSRRPGGIFEGFMGTGILLAGVRNSEIAGNVFSANAGADIAFGAVESSPPNTGNRVTGNGGVVVLSKKSYADNHIEGSQTMVRTNAPAPPAAKTPKGAKPAPATKGPVKGPAKGPAKGPTKGGAGQKK